MVRLLCRTGAALVLGAGVVSAQQNDPPIPAELVRAMMAGPFGSTPTSFIVGKLPPSWPADLAPRDAGKPLGLVDQRWQRIAVFAVAETPELIIPDFAAALTRAGWSPPPPRPQPGGFGMTGLQSAPPTQLCRGDSLVTVSGAPRLTGGYVYVALQTTTQAYQCRMPMLTNGTAIDAAGTVTFRTTRVGPVQVPVPMLRPPDGMQTLGSSSSGGFDRWDGETRLRTGLRAAELLDLYGAQLARGGWTLGERVAGTGVATQLADRRDSTGITWRATLTASALGDSLQRELALHIVSKTSR